MEYKDYYAVLGVPRTATQAEIKKAYRRLARQLHPDRNPGDAAAEKRFKEANEAHAVLSDATKRRQYDELGSNWQAYQQTGFGGGGTDWAGFGGAPGGMRWETRQVDPSDLGGFSDFFRAFFGAGASGAPGGGFDFGSVAGGGRPAPRAGGAAPGQPTAEATADVSLAEVVRGAERMVSVDGRRIQVTIPAGVADGGRIRLRGAGPRRADGAPGDLLVRVRIQPDPRFERHGADLATELPVTLAEAILGAEVPVPTPTGSVKLRIRPNTQNGQEIHLAGRGLPKRSGGRGDLVVRTRIVLPTLDEASREAVAEALARHPQPDPRREGEVH